MATNSTQGPQGHKRFSPSGLKQRRLCPGSLAMEEALPKSERDTGDTVASRRGTCAHTVGEMAIESYINGGTTTPDHFEGQEIETVIVDDAIVEGSQHYYDNCIKIVDICGPENSHLEKRYSLAHFIDEYDNAHGTDINPSDTGGTADFTAVDYDWGTLYVRDYKNGRGLVEVENNDQLLSYALGALLEFDCDDIDDVEMGIDQPNAVHGSGETLRIWTVPKTHVYKWANEEMIPIMETCLEAVESLKRGDADFAEKYIVPGEEQCMWCPARARCQKAQNDSFEGALIEFETALTDLDNDFYPNNQVVCLPEVNRLSDDEIAKVLAAADQIEGYIKAVRQMAKLRADSGQSYSTHKLVQINTHRKIRTGMNDQVAPYLKKLGLRAVDFMTVPKLRSPNQLEQALKKSGAEQTTITRFLDRFVEKPDGGTQLVPMNDSRKAVAPAIEAEFEELFDTDDFDFEDDFDLDLEF